MVQCARCGISGDRATLFDAISKDGVIKICEECAFREDIPIIKRPTSFQLKAAVTPSSVYNRLSNMAGLNPEEHRQKFSQFPSRRSEPLKKPDVTLRDIVDRDYQKRTQGKEGVKIPRPDLVDNFHWIIMRARRMKKLSFAQVAKEIAESEQAIENAEKGVLPEDPRFIRKLESYYGISLIKKDPIEQIREKPKNINFEDIVSKNLTIADLKDMQRETEKLALKRKEPEEEIEMEEEDIEEDVPSMTDMEQIQDEENE